MPIELTCAKCGKFHVLPDAMAGKTGKCPCGASIVVSAAKPAVPSAAPMAPATIAKSAPQSMARKIGAAVVALILVGGFFARTASCMKSMNAPPEVDKQQLVDLARKTMESRCAPANGFVVGVIHPEDVRETEIMGSKWEVSVPVSGGALLVGATFYVQIHREGDLLRVVEIKSQLDKNREFGGR